MVIRENDRENEGYARVDIVTNDNGNNSHVTTKRRRVTRMDGGYGWAIAFGCFLIHFLLGGYSRSYGLIYIRVKERFRDSAAVTAWVGGAQVAVRMGLSPVSNALARKYGTRPVVIVGGVLLALGSSLTGFISNSYELFFTYTLISGIGASLTYSPSLVILSQYFDKKRGVAMSLASCGSAIGAFLFPSAMLLSFELFGFLPALVVIGAFMGNASIAGCLYRPFVRGDSFQVMSIEMKEQSKINENINIENNVDDTVEIIKHNEKKIDEKRNTSILRFILYMLRKLSGFLDLSLWKDSRFALYALSQGFSVSAYIPMTMLIPAFGLEKSLTAVQTGYLLSAIAVGDFCARLMSGFVFDLKPVRCRRWLPYAVAMLLSMVCMWMWTVLAWYPLWLINAAINGSMNGITVSQRTNMLCDIMNNDRISSALGMLIFTQGASLLFGPYFAGLVSDIFGTYDASFTLMAVFQTLSTICFMLCTYISIKK